MASGHHPGMDAVCYLGPPGDLHELRAQLTQAPAEADLVLTNRCATPQARRLGLTLSLGRQLAMLSAALGQTGRRALELVAAPPEAASLVTGFTSALGTALTTPAEETGPLAATAQAVHFFREAARQEPAHYLPDLAAALRDHAVQLGAAGRDGEALTTAQDAVAVLQHVAKQDPAALPSLADGLNDLAVRLTVTDRDREAVSALEDAVAIRRHLANGRPARFLPALAASLDELADALSAVGKRRERLAAVEDAVTIRRHLARCLPERFLPDLATSLHELGQGLGAAGDEQEALAILNEAVAVRRLLAEGDHRHLTDLAASLQALSVGLGTIGQLTEGLAIGREAAALFRHLAGSDGLAGAVENVAINLAAMELRDASREASEEAAALRRPRQVDCCCPCHHPAAARPAPYVDTTAITGPTPVVAD